MKLIAHRGNYVGINRHLENKPEYIREALGNGYDVEIDVRLVNGTWYLGHDEPQYKINITDYLDERYWLHCKNSEAFESLFNKYNVGNFFWHQEDDYTMTSSGLIWAYPGVKRLDNSVVLFPKSAEDVINVYGVCDNDFSEIKTWIL
jgi:hypothetical protein